MSSIPEPTAPTPPLPTSGAVRVRELVIACAPSSPPVARTRLDGERVVLGRAPEGPRRLAVADAQISRSHAALTYDAAHDAWSLSDLESRNGTYVDGARVARAP